MILPGDPISPVFVQPSPFKAQRYDMVVAEGQTLQAVVEATGYPPSMWPQLTVYVGSHAVPQALWRVVKAKRGVPVYIQVRLGKNVGRIVAMIAIAVVAFAVGWYLAPMWMPGTIMGSTTLATVATTALANTIAMGVMTAGMYLVNALIPPPSPKNSYGFDQQLGNPYAQIMGLANRMVPYGPIPRVVGKRRIYPMLAARPYTETVGNVQYLRMLLMCGYGPLDISQLKIGETAIEQIAGAQWEILEGWEDDPEPTLFQKNIQEDQYQIELTPYRQEFVRTTRQNTVEVSVDIAALGGLIEVNNKGKAFEHEVWVTVDYRPTGSTGGWTPAPWIDGDSDYGTGTDGLIKLKDKSQSAVIRSGRFAVPKGQYDIRVKRETQLAENLGDNTVADAVWLTAIRSIVDSDPTPMKGISYVALRLKATAQMNGAPDNINCVAHSYLPHYDADLGTWTWALSRNPGWAYIDMMRRRGLKTLIPDSRIDLASGSPLLQWAEDCNAAPPNGGGPYWTFDGVFEGGSVFNALRQIASHGRAAFTIRDGKYSVVQDKEQTVPVQHITPRNSWGYTGYKAFIDLPHAFRVRFSNEEKGYAEDEVIVYRPGYSRDGGDGTTAAQKFETLELPGCTRPTQAWREGMYHLAVAMLRPEQHVVSLDVENLRCTLGSFVRLTHDVILIGLGSGRVLERVEDGGMVTGLRLDNAVSMEAGKSYALRARLQSGMSVVAPVNTVDGDTEEVTLVTPMALDVAPRPGDLYMFGESGRESAPMIVRKIEPGPDFTARLTLVDAQSGVWTADTGVIPPFDSYITDPVLPGSQTPPPIDFILDSGNLTYFTAPDGTVKARIAVTFYPLPPSPVVVDGIEVQYRNASSPTYVTLPRYPRETSSLWIEDVYVDDTYFVRARTVSVGGYTSDWTEHSIVAGGKGTPPQPPTELAVMPGYQQLTVTYTPAEDIDLLNTEIWSSETNDRATATLVGKVPSPANTFVHTGLENVSTHYYWARSADTSGNLSEFHPADPLAGVEGVTTESPTGPIDTIPPAAVTGLEASGGMQQASLRWQNPVDADLNRVDLYRHTANNSDNAVLVGSVAAAPGGAGVFVDSPLDPTSTYWWWAKAVDRSGNESGFSVPAWATTQDTVFTDTTPPGPPTQFAAEPGLRSVWVSWVAPTDPDTSRVDVFMSQTPDFSTATRVASVQSPPGIANGFQVGGLETNTEYHFWGRAFDLSGNGSGITDIATCTTLSVDPGDVGTVVGFNPPTGVTFTSAAAIDTDGAQVVTMTASWSAITDPAFSYYELGVSTDGGSSYAVYTAPENTYALRVLANTAYRIRVRGVDRFGNRTGWSSHYDGTTAKKTGAPTAVTPLVATGGVGAVRLSWQNPSNPDLTQVQVYRNTTNNAGTATLIGTANAQPGQIGGWNDTGLTTLQTYYYWFKSVDRSGNTSGFSSSLSASPRAIGNDDLVADSISADRLKSNTSLPPTLRLTGTGFDLSVGQVAQYANDPAARINSGGPTTMIQPGRIQISGGVAMTDWIMPGQTTINGGKLATNSVRAESIVVASRGIDVSGIVFDFNAPFANYVSWTTGTISYVNDSGVGVTNPISSGGSAQWNGGVLYIYWTKGSWTLQATSSAATAYSANNVVLATYRGNKDLNVTYGGTIIDGANMKTGSLNADRIAAGTMTAAVFNGRQITADVVKIGTLQADNIVGGGLSTPFSAGAQFNQAITQFVQNLGVYAPLTTGTTGDRVQCHAFLYATNEGSLPENVHLDLYRQNQFGGSVLLGQFGAVISPGRGAWISVSQTDQPPVSQIVNYTLVVYRDGSQPCTARSWKVMGIGIKR